MTSPEEPSAVPGVVETIRQRASWRNYLPEPLEETARRALTDRIAALPRPPFPARCRFELVDAPSADQDRVRQLGTYGIISGATTFVAGAVQAGEKDLEVFGFLLEHIILDATALGLGTCWLGGTFNRSGFGAALNVRPDERMPAVTPVGKVASRRGIRDRFLRRTADSANRRPWEDLFFTEDGSTPLSRQLAGDFAVPLEMVRLGPSASNKQPWRVLKAEGRPLFHFFLQRNRMYGVLARSVLGTDDLQRLDLGIAMCHFQLTATALGRSGRWTAEPPVDRVWPKGAEYIATWTGD